jgi:hypothetical protein
VNFWLPPTWILDGSGLVRGVTTPDGKSDVEKWNWDAKTWVPASNADFAEALPPRGKLASASELAALGIPAEDRASAVAF